jgi:hypothetical protein
LIYKEISHRRCRLGARQIAAAATGGRSEYSRPAHQCIARVPPLPKEAVMDVIYVLAVIALYAVTHWLVFAIERLRNPQ